MQPDWLSRRVTLVEQRVDRLETQITGLRGEMNERFDAVEQVLISLQTQITSNHREATGRFDELGRHMRVLHEDLIDRIAKIKG